MKKLLLSIAFVLPAMGMMAQTQVKTAEGILEGKDLSGITVFKGIPLSLIHISEPTRHVTLSRMPSSA